MTVRKAEDGSSIYYLQNVFNGGGVCWGEGRGGGYKLEKKKGGAGEEKDLVTENGDSPSPQHSFRRHQGQGGQWRRCWERWHSKYG